METKIRHPTRVYKTASRVEKLETEGQKRKETRVQVNTGHEPKPADVTRSEKKINISTSHYRVYRKQ